jgi:hypothetical protein
MSRDAFTVCALAFLTLGVVAQRYGLVLPAYLGIGLYLCSLYLRPIRK